VAGDVAQAVCAAYTASVAAGEPLSQRALAQRFGVSRRKVSRFITAPLTPANGHAPAGQVQG
jgi:transcriptional regulator GlxA family with amidase domain